MLLAPVARARDEIGLSQRRRLTEHGSCYGGAIAGGEGACQRRRRIRIGCEALGELHPGFQLDDVDQDLISSNSSACRFEYRAEPARNKSVIRVSALICLFVEPDVAAS